MHILLCSVTFYGAVVLVNNVAGTSWKIALLIQVYQEHCHLNTYDRLIGFASNKQCKQTNNSAISKF